MTPDLALMEAVRAALIARNDLTALVPADHIRAGSIRPDTFPAVVLSMPGAEITGHASGGQIVASFNMLLHVWTRDDDAETAQRIGAAVLRALMDAPRSAGLSFDGWDRPRLAWVADPAQQALHGAVSLAAVVRWKQ